LEYSQATRLETASQHLAHGCRRPTCHDRITSRTKPCRDVVGSGSIVAIWLLRGEA
jgi:hypothetical protein